MTGITTPRHVAFIMDGNGRWASRRLLPRLRGHERGADVLREITEYCTQEKIGEITFFALSTENYERRPKREIDGLMRLLRRFLISERKTIRENNIRFRVIGRIEELPPAVQAEIERSVTESAGNSGMILRLALNYGSRQEILDAVARLLEEERAREGAGSPRLPLTERDLTLRFYDPDMTDPDLVIRTAGEYRISNFLLWQVSYSELFFVDVPWPEFSVQHLQEAVAVFRSRERNFGSVRAAIAHEDVE